MNMLADRYALFIVHSMLRLEDGDRLTIHSNEETIEFAHKVAHEAADTTGVPVSLVYIEKGRVDSVDEISPDFPARQAEGDVMLHLASFTSRPFDRDAEMDAVNLQNHRLLADPIFLDRRISIPYAVAYVPTAAWAEFVYGPGSTVDQLYLDLADFLSLDEGMDVTSTLERTLRHRATLLNGMDIERLQLKSPTMELECSLAKGARIGTTASRLSGGRFFYPTFPCEDLIFPIDFSKAATFVPGDGEYIEFVYTANFENANAGTDKKVTVSSLSLKATDEQYAHIAASYYISSTNTFRDLKADITPVEVTVEFTIPDKTYDGTRFVNMTNEAGGWELKAPLDDDGNPVRDTWYVAGEPNIGNYGVNILTANFNEADVAMDGNNNPIAQYGTVIGFELVCGALNVANYVLVVDSKDVTYDLYSLATLADLPEEQVNSIQGVIYEDGMWLYLVEQGVTLNDGTYQDTCTYPTAKATGKILPAAVTFTVTIVDKTEFTNKVFDDTTAFTGNPIYGRVGQTGDYDYYITLSSGEAGFTISEDDIHIAFAGAAVGVQDVIFTIDAVTGGSSNYVFNDADNSYTVRGGGYINKFNGTINAKLVSNSEEGGITATYGTADLSYTDTVRYYYAGAAGEVDIIVDAEGNAYVTLDGWKAMFGHDDDDLTADVMTRRYTKANGEWQQSNNGDYIRITGKFGTPTLLTKEGGSEFVDKDGLVCVDAGTYATAYLDVKADSFAFDIHTASVIIKAKDLRVYVTNAGEGGNFTADYFVGKLPVPVFGLYMNGDVNDLAAFDTWAAVQKTLRGQFMNADRQLSA